MEKNQKLAKERGGPAIKGAITRPDVTGITGGTTDTSEHEAVREENEVSREAREVAEGPEHNAEHNA